jgi:exosortase
MLKMPLFWKRNGWSQYHAITLALVTALAIWFTRDAWGDILFTAWNEEESSHILLVPIVAIWLVFARRERFRHCLPQGGWIGVPMVFVGWMLSSYGYSHRDSLWAPVLEPVLWLPLRLVDLIAQTHVVDRLDAPILSFWHLGAVLIVVGAALTVLGRDIFRRFLPAFIVLLFLVPVPGFMRAAIAQPLQAKLAYITKNIFDVMGIEVLQNGNQLEINGVKVAIAEACNGMRMVFALVLVSYLFAFATPLRNYVRVIIVAASPMSAMLCNIIRMVPTVWLFGLSKEPILGMNGDMVAHKFHDYAGWVMLVIAFLLLMGIIKTLMWALVPVQPYTLAVD